MSDIICTNCGGQSTTGCWLCNPDNFPGANEYADPLDKTYWAKEAGRLSAENAFLTQRLEKLQAENTRIVAEAKQCHEQNDRLVSERILLRQSIRELQAEVARLKQEQVDFEYNASCIISTEERRAEAAEAKLRGANAEIERQKGLVRNYLETIEGNEIDIAGLLEKLRAVGELRKYTDVEVEEYLRRTNIDPLWIRADQVEALLRR